LEETKKILQGLKIPYSALILIIFGLMIFSFPIGAFVMFNSEIGQEINFEFPLSGVGFFGNFIDDIPFDIEIGDAFIVIWIIFIILFSISVLGPKKNFLKTLDTTATVKPSIETNYLVYTIKWFSILILVSGIINFVQESVGIVIQPPTIENNLIQFFNVSVAPLSEEIGFRVLLIGQSFLKSLWRPREYLHIEESRKAIILIVGIALLFGFSHIMFGESWSSGKFAQATAGGIIIGWVYFRVGLVPAILIHWATNYFIFSYVYLIVDINMIPIQEAFSHSLMMSFEVLFMVLGSISIAIMIIKNRYFKREKIEV
jgi:hypothetical protein